MNVLLILLCYSIAYTSDKRVVAADHKDSAAGRNGSAKDVAARKSAMLSSSSAKQVADHQVKGGGQRSSSTKVKATYRRNWAGQKTQSTRLSFSTKKVGNYRRVGAARRGVSVKNVALKQKVPLGSKQRGYRVPVANVSIKPSISFKTQKTQRRGFARIVNSKTTRKMLRKIMFTTAARDGPARQTANNASAKPVRFRMPTRVGPHGNLEIVTSKTTPMPPFDPSKPIARHWRVNRGNITIQAVNIMTQIVYATQGQTMERVERVAEEFKHDTRYRIAFILLKLDQICTEMTRKQTFMEHNIDYKFNHYVLRRKFPFRKMLAFYTDMLRQNIDVTYAVEYVFQLYKDKALERQSAEEAKKSRETMLQTIAKQNNG